MFGARPACRHQLFPEGGAGAVQADRRVVRGDALLGSDLRKRQVLELGRDEDFPILLLERRNQVVHASTDGLFQLAVDIRPRLASEPVERPPLRGLRAEVVGDRMAKQPVEPRDDAFLVSNLVRVLESLGHRRLKNLLRELAVADSTREKRQELTMAADEDSSDIEEMFYEGSDLQGEGRYDEAMACFDRCLALDPDYADALLGKAKQGRTHIVEHARALSYREGDFKLVEGNDGPARNKQTNTELGNAPLDQLYDVSADPGERKNVAPLHSERAKLMSAALDRIKRAGRSRP